MLTIFAIFVCLPVKVLLLVPHPPPIPVPLALLTPMILFGSFAVVSSVTSLFSPLYMMMLPGTIGNGLPLHKHMRRMLVSSWTPTTAPLLPLRKHFLRRSRSSYMLCLNTPFKLTKANHLYATTSASLMTQTIYKELCEYALKPTKATIDAAGMLTYITTACLGNGTWKGTTHASILHWQDQVCKRKDLATGQTFVDNALCTMLENAVDAIENLCAVKTQAQQIKVATSNSLTYQEYCSILTSAAQTYDKAMLTSKPKATCHCVYEHEFGNVDDNYSIDYTFCQCCVH